MNKHELTTQAGALRNLPIKQDTWLRGVTKDEMEDLKGAATNAPWQLGAAFSALSSGLTTLIATAMTTAPEPWMWTLGGALSGMGGILVIVALQAPRRVATILNRIEQRHKTEEEMARLPEPVSALSEDMARAKVTIRSANPSNDNGEEG